MVLLQEGGVDTDRILRAYSIDDFPVFNCPRCQHGILLLNKETLVCSEPAFSENRMKQPGSDPTDFLYRFFLQFCCNGKTCGEKVAVIGSSGVAYDYDENGEMQYEQYYQPKAFFPAPVLISLPKNTPDGVKRLVRAASSVAWSDYNAAANRLRVCAEVLLDELGVSREDRDTLNKRIKRLDEPLADHKDILDALRYVGNVGSHGEDVTRQVLINSFQLFEYMLEELYGGRKEKMQQIAKSLIETRGRG